MMTFYSRSLENSEKRQPEATHSDCWGEARQQCLAEQRAMAAIDSETFGGAPNRVELANQTRSAVINTLGGTLKGAQDILKTGNMSQLDAYVRALTAANVFAGKTLGTDGSAALSFPVMSRPDVNLLMHPGSTVVQKNGQLFHMSAQDRSMTSLTPEEAQKAVRSTISNSLERVR